MEHPFIIGEVFANRLGEYTVLSIAGDSMTVEYIDGEKAGQKQTLDIKGQWRVYRNMRRERLSMFVHDSPGFFRALGFLAANATFDAEIPPKSAAAFALRYREDAGEQPDPGTDHYFLLDGDPDKWGPELRIYFPEPAAGLAVLDFGPSVDVRSSTRPGEVRINNNRFWWQLIGLGFRLGTAQTVANIQANIPKKDLDGFMEGVGLALP